MCTHAAWKHLLSWTDLLSTPKGIHSAQSSVMLSYQLRWRAVYLINLWKKIYIVKQQTARACFYYIIKTIKTLSDNRKWHFATVILKLCLFYSFWLARYSSYTRLKLWAIYQQEEAYIQWVQPLMGIYYQHVYQQYLYSVINMLNSKLVSAKKTPAPRI